MKRKNDEFVQITSRLDEDNRLSLLTFGQMLITRQQILKEQQEKKKGGKTYGKEKGGGRTS